MCPDISFLGTFDCLFLVNGYYSLVSVFFLIVLLVISLAACVSSSTGDPEPEESLDEAAIYNTELGRNYIRQGKYDVAMDRLQRSL